MDFITSTRVGVCIDCGAVIQQPTGRGRPRKRCDACLKIKAQYDIIKWRKRKIAGGCCISCGQRKEAGDGQKCRPCQNKNNAAAANIRAKFKASITATLAKNKEEKEFIP